MVHGDEVIDVADPQRLRVRTWVTEELCQDGATRDMIFSCAAMIERLWTALTLEPGMVRSTGTSPGVAASGNPPCRLIRGNLVRIEIGGLEALGNPVVSESGP